MSRFLQLHVLTFYPPSNLNRDDTGRPKSAMMGGAERLRVSSQAIKRAVRTSDVFEQALGGHLGKRTQRFGEDIEAHLITKGATPERAREIARAVANLFGKVIESKESKASESKDVKDDGDTERKSKGSKGDGDRGKKGTAIARTEQLAFIGPQERETAFALAETLLADGKDEIKLKPEQVLRQTDSVVDIAMFGRMMASAPDFNREAAVQVAHAVTTHKAPVEDDFYTAVDDLKKPAEDAGAGFMGELGFGSGVFYLYVCADLALLTKNLGGDNDLAARGLKAFTTALVTVSPTGKQASFASRARAEFILAEAGDQQPRTLASAFVRPIRGENILVDSIATLKATRSAMDKAYGACADGHIVMDVPNGEGSLDEVLAYVAAAAR